MFALSFHTLATTGHDEALAGVIEWVGEDEEGLWVAQVGPMELRGTEEGENRGNWLEQPCME